MQTVWDSSHAINFYPRPPGGGRPMKKAAAYPFWRFLSTPSGWRATHSAGLERRRTAISIHALRVEGDGAPLPRYPHKPISIHALRVEGDGLGRRDMPSTLHFYPRPPGGGRHSDEVAEGIKKSVFLSTPSGWRATSLWLLQMLIATISIHALRVEGDPFWLFRDFLNQRFLSTPSGWRATEFFQNSC